MSEETSRKPFATVRIRGGISAAVWRNEIATSNGSATVENITLQRRYFDKKTNEWQTATSFRREDLPRVALVAQILYERLMVIDSHARSEEGDDTDFPPTEE